MASVGLGTIDRVELSEYAATSPAPGQRALKTARSASQVGSNGSSPRLPAPTGTSQLEARASYQARYGWDVTDDERSSHQSQPVS